MKWGAGSVCLLRLKGPPKNSGPGCSEIIWRHTTEALWRLHTHSECHTLCGSHTRTVGAHTHKQWVLLQAPKPKPQTYLSVSRQEPLNDPNTKTPQCAFSIGSTFSHWVRDCRTHEQKNPASKASFHSPTSPNARQAAVMRGLQLMSKLATAGSAKLCGAHTPSLAAHAGNAPCPTTSISIAYSCTLNH